MLNFGKFIDKINIFMYNVLVATVAQSVEQLIRNEQVAGSNPVSSSILYEKQ